MRDYYCGDVTDTLLEKEITLCGWVQRRRDHGGVIFIDLRDRNGLVQVVFEPELAEIFQRAEQLRNEFVIQIKGRVRARPEGMINSNIKTGTIEVVAGELTILNRSEPPPFMLDEYNKTSEEVRLQYRYLDLRRPEMTQRLQMRAKVAKFLRHYLDEEGFFEIETPILTKATPEGARDYLVPSRTHVGQFFALPQSPQLFKQLLMMSGIDRYYQIVRCFRDEDLRADRQPEFTQLDIEASFVQPEDVQRVTENMIRDLFKAILNVDLPNPFPRLSYAEAMRRFGNDRPDLRIPLELVDIADLLKDVEFKVFSGPANDPDGRVAALCLPKGSELTRKDIDEYTSFVGIYGAKGLAYIKVNDMAQGSAGLQSPILKFLTEDAIREILRRTGAQDGDVIFFGADKAEIVNEALGALRVKLGHDRNLLEGEWCPLWVDEFPMFAYSHEHKRWQPMHHPFTNPIVNDLSELEGGKLTHIQSHAYDMVLNGTEIGGGSIRIHDPKVQRAVLKALGMDDTEADDKFGFLLTALKYGCPPHGGIAFGLDRLVMLMAGASSIREVIAFPKTQTASCPLTAAPSAVSDGQLAELNIRLRKKIEV